MKLGLVLLLTGGMLGYLTVVDRMSPVALYAVELDSTVGVPVWAVLLAVGALLMVRALFSGRKRPPVEQRLKRSYAAQQNEDSQREDRQRAAAPSGAGGDWRSDIFNQARALALEGGARVQLNRNNAPVGLLLERSTTERARRNIEALARFLSTIPVPARARLTFKDCPTPGTPWGKLVEGAFRQHFAAGSFRVVSQRDEIDVLFSDPDPRWADPD